MEEETGNGTRPWTSLIGHDRVQGNEGQPAAMHETAAAHGEVKAPPRGGSLRLVTLVHECATVSTVEVCRHRASLQVTHPRAISFVENSLGWVLEGTIILASSRTEHTLLIFWGSPLGILSLAAAWPLPASPCEGIDEGAARTKSSWNTRAANMCSFPPRMAGPATWAMSIILLMPMPHPSLDPGLPMYSKMYPVAPGPAKKVSLRDLEAIFGEKSRAASSGPPVHRTKLTINIE